MPRRLEWEALEDDLAELERRLAAEPGDVLVSGIPNERAARPVVQTLASMDAQDTVWDLERALWGADERSGLHPEEAVELAARLGRRVRLLVPADGRLDHFDVLFEPHREKP